MRKLALVAVAGIVVAVGYLPVPASQEIAAAETGVAVTDNCALEAGALRFNVLLLLDSSLSLQRTDPRNARRDGLAAVVNSLASLERTWSYLNELSEFDFEINIGVDTFATGYTPHHRWQGAGAAQRDLIGRYDDITDLPTGGETTLTDYRQALSGAAWRFGQVPVEGCNLVLWFTDGEHATDGTSRDVSPEEWNQLQDLCDSDAMELLSERGVWTQAVLLTDGSPSDNPLRLLFGELLGGGGCQYELDGEISQLDAEGLESALGEFIAEAVSEVVCGQPTPYLLPGEQDSCRPTDPPKPCADDGSIAGNGTENSPCEYRCTLKPEVESFRLSVDLTFLNRGIRNPDDVNMRLQAPSGRESNPIFHTEDDSAGYQAVDPFWFLSRRLYRSRWEVIGHQAAKQLAQNADWEWQGEWKILFWGDTSDSSEDASKAAAAIKVITTDSPDADLGLNEEGNLVGFIQNFPDGYQSVELRLRLDDGTGDPVYPTRPYLTCQRSPCDPVRVKDDQGHRLEVPRIKDEVMWWDTAEAGGDGQKLTTAIADHGPVGAVAVLDQEFYYGGADGFGPSGERGQPLAWQRDIGSIELDLNDVLDDHRSVEAAMNRWERMKEDVGDRGSLGWSAPESVASSEMKFEVEAMPGYLPWVATIDDMRPWVDGIAMGGSSHQLNWSCEIPGKWKQVDAAVTHDCPALEVDLRLSEDAEVEVETDFGFARPAGLEEELRVYVSFEGDFHSWAPSEEEWSAFWNSIEEPTTSPGAVTIVADLPTVGDKLREFLLILVALILLALLLRVFAAWRLRPWSPLASPDYLVVPFSSDPDNPLEADLGNERQFSFELSRRSAAARVGDLRVFSAWRPLLLGRPPRLAAKSLSGKCIGPQGSISNRKSEHVGLIGNGLETGWALDISPAGDSLIVWDLPSDEFEAQVRINDAQHAASYQIEEKRVAQKDDEPAGPPAGQAEGGSKSSPEKYDDPLATEQPSQFSDPSASGEFKTGSDSDYIDPFDR